MGQKLRVRGSSSGSAEGLKISVRSAHTGSRGERPLWGLGQSPTKATEQATPKRSDRGDREDGGLFGEGSGGPFLGPKVVRPHGSEVIGFGEEGVVDLSERAFACGRFFGGAEVELLEGRCGGKDESNARVRGVK